jgi:mRNA-degrading endonuclease toxin of MazEF toxin-antitoxin module
LAPSPTGGHKPSVQARVRRRRARQALEPHRGEIWYVYTPGQPDDHHQTRPALVVSEDVRNRMRDDLIVVPMFSRGRPGPTRVSINAGTGGAPAAGILFCEEITTIDRDFLENGPMGPPIPRHRMDEVVRALRRAIGELVPEP